MARSVLVALMAMIRSTPSVVVLHDNTHSITTVAQWAPFSITLNASGDARKVENPFTDVELVVVWTPPTDLSTADAPKRHRHGGVSGDVNAQDIDAPPIGSRAARGFWDGDYTWRVATFFPKAGMWTWRTEVSPHSTFKRLFLICFFSEIFKSINEYYFFESEFETQITIQARTRNGAVVNDTGLTASGVVHVSPPDPTHASNPFSVHGGLRVAAAKTHLVHADGTKFFWLGDTAWAGPMMSTSSEWEKYLTARRAQGFTVAQVGIAMWWCGATNRAGEPAFVGPNNATNLTHLNPLFFREYAARIEAAGEAGMAVLIVG